MTHKPEAGGGSRRVSQNAPGFVSPSHQAWEDALSDPRFRRALAEGKADAEAGRTKPWTKIRSQLAK